MLERSEVALKLVMLQMAKQIFSIRRMCLVRESSPHGSVDKNKSRGRRALLDALG